MQEWTITAMQAMMSAGEISAHELAQLYLERIELLDRAGPRLNAIIELNPDALAEAARLDRERAEGHVRGPLHGIPLLLKDNIDTGDRMTTTAGSLALEGSIAAQDAFVAAQLRAAGAFFLGKTNLSEWANFRSTHSISGWSSRGGQVRNPYALDRSPIGSSSGSAVAVAANLCAAAIGTETDGSIIFPAFANGIVGLKPTLGLVSRSGIIPIASSQDTAGPMARTVADVAVLLGAMTGVDPRDPATASSAGKGLGDYSPCLQAGGLRGARIGVARNCFGFHPGVDEIIEGCLAVLRAQGAVLVDPANLENKDKVRPTEIEVFDYEFKAGLNAYLGGLGPGVAVHSLDELIAFNQRNRARVMPLFGQEHMLRAQAKGPLSEETYLKALETNRRLAREEGIDALLQQHNLDAVVAPSGPPAWLVDTVSGDCSRGGGCSTIPAVAGTPHITVPAGLVRGLPVGISFLGAAYSEQVLLKLAFAFEQATHARCAPSFLPGVDSTE